MANSGGMVPALLSNGRFIQAKSRSAAFGSIITGAAFSFLNCPGTANAQIE
jgi:hypothetical protein